MRRLSPGDITRKLAQIEHSGRSRRWRRRARAQLLKDVGAVPVPGTDHLRTPTGQVCAKRRYPTFSTAYQALIDTWKSLSKWRREKRVHPCRYCGGWHLTSKDYIWYEEHPNGDTEERTEDDTEERTEDDTEERTEDDRRKTRKGQGSGTSDPSGSTGSGSEPPGET